MSGITKGYLKGLRAEYLRERTVGNCNAIRDLVISHAKSGQTQYFWLSTGFCVEQEVPDILKELKLIFPDSEVVQVRNEFGPGILVNWE
jgi:hypothetical protein